MKRGLVLFDPAEIPVDEWRGRVAAVQRELAASGTDVALIYGDVSRSDDIAYLTNLCVYWNEGILAVPAHGAPVFLTKLSPRVHPWMRLISTVTEIRSGRSFAELVAAFLSPGDGGTVGLIEADLWPAAVAAQIRQALAGWEVRPLDGLVRAQRQTPSPAEVALLGRAAASLADTAADAAAGRAHRRRAGRGRRAPTARRRLPRRPRRTGPERRRGDIGADHRPVPLLVAAGQPRRRRRRPGLARLAAGRDRGRRGRGGTRRDRGRPRPGGQARP